MMLSNLDLDNKELFFLKDVFGIAETISNKILESWNSFIKIRGQSNVSGKSVSCLGRR